MLHRLSILSVVLLLAACTPVELQSMQTEPDATSTSAVDSVLPTMQAPTLTVLPTTSPTVEPTMTIAVNLDTPTLKPSAGLHICTPLEDHPIEELSEIVSDPYNPPRVGRDERHQGVDFSYYERGDRNTIEGVVVQSILPGVVVGSFTDQIPYGNIVMIETLPDMLPESVRDLYQFGDDGSIYHLYAHMLASPEVGLGDVVACGQALGYVGKTGYNIVNAHLHLEVRTGPAGANFEEMSFYNTRASEQAMENYHLWRMSGVFQHHDPMDIFQAYLDSIPN